jgi:hypothetical protein
LKIDKEKGFIEFSSVSDLSRYCFDDFNSTEFSVYHVMLRTKERGSKRLQLLALHLRAFDWNTAIEN